MVYGNIKDVFSSILGALVFYANLIEWISRLRKDWMLSLLICLHGTHFNGIRQVPNNNI
jgi:hypothetical protein